MSTESNARPPVQPTPPPSDPAASWWGPALQPRDDGWPLRYIPLPPPPPAPWRWRWSFWTGIMYGPIPVGLIAVFIMLLAANN